MDFFGLPFYIIRKRKHACIHTIASEEASKRVCIQTCKQASTFLEFVYRLRGAPINKASMRSARPVSPFKHAGKQVCMHAGHQ